MIYSFSIDGKNMHCAVKNYNRVEIDFTVYSGSDYCFIFLIVIAYCREEEWWAIRDSIYGNAHNTTIWLWN